MSLYEFLRLPGNDFNADGGEFNQIAADLAINCGETVSRPAFPCRQYATSWRFARKKTAISRHLPAALS